MSKESIPIVVGAAQHTQAKNASKPLDPISLMAKACIEAIEDVGIDGLKKYIDTLYVSNVYCLYYEKAPDDLSNLLDIKPMNKFYSPIGGNTPQMLINRAAQAIASGKSQIVLMTGGESCYSYSRGKKKEIVLDWPKGSSTSTNKALIEFASKMSKSEKIYKIFQPSNAYALFETALRAQSGRSVEDHWFHMGRLFERFSKKASENPYAWIQKAFNTEEIAVPSPDNRIVNHPYFKRLVANPYVDQSAALIVTSEIFAEKLGIDRDLWIYPMGGADIDNIHDLARRPRLYDSPAIKAASKLALKQAGLKLEDIHAFDLYSCFPCMVDIAINEIGILEDDPRDLTLTGGLPFFGGPFNNYSMHAIVCAIDMIRGNQSMKVMITANGGYNTKQSIGIYGKEPPLRQWSEYDVDSIQKSILADILPEPVEQANGILVIEAYTIYYDRNGEPTGGLMIGNIEGEGRALAEIEASSETLKKLAREELVGSKYKVKYDAKVQRNKVFLTA